MAYRFVECFEDVGSGITPSSGAKLFFFDVGTSDAKETFADFALTVSNPDPVVANPNGIFPDIFLDTDADRTLKDKNNVLIYGPDTVHAPDSSIAAIAASIVTVLDTDGNFTAADLELVLKELADDWMKKDRAETITGTKTFSSADINLADNLLIRAEIKDFSLTVNQVSSVSGTLTIDLEDGNSFHTLLTENISTMTVTGVPATAKGASFELEITQDGAGGGFTVATPTGTIIPGAGSYLMSAGNDAVDDLTFRSRDNGTIWKLDFSQAYA